MISSNLKAIYNLNEKRRILRKRKHLILCLKSLVRWAIRLINDIDEMHKVLKLFVLKLIIKIKHYHRSLKKINKFSELKRKDLYKNQFCHQKIFW